MNLVKGQDISISIESKMIACWRSSTLNVNVDTIGISTIGSGDWKEFEGNVISWSVSGEGLLYMDASFTIHDLFDLAVQLLPVDVVFTVVSKDAAGTIITIVTYTGIGIITGITETGNVNDNASFNVTIQGSGKLTRV